MTDLEMTRLCAMAMGLPLLKAREPGDLLYSAEHVHEGLMYSRDGDREFYFVESGAYDPIHCDEQAMALLKRFRLTVVWGNHVENGPTWYVDECADANLNRAIVQAAASRFAALPPSTKET